MKSHNIGYDNYQLLICDGNNRFIMSVRTINKKK